MEEYQNNGILIEDLDESNDNLLISFGGIRQGFGIPVFEFYKSFSELQCTKVFIRDFNQMWYQNGVDNDISSIYELSEYLQEFISRNNYSNVCFIGNSMGGYAAILLGVLLKVDKIYAFSPQSFIDPKNRLYNFDFRWRKQIKKVSKYSKSSRFLDLKKIISEKDLNSRIEIHYSTKHRLDKLHSERLKDIKGVHLIPYNFGGHNIIKDLKNSGQLQVILDQVFNLQRD